ncbi:MAG: quinol:cytochrome C oxidoreductase [Planctomycetota bacterium]
MHGQIELPKRDQVIVRDLAKPATIALGVGVVGLLATAGLGVAAGDEMLRFGHAMLIGILFFLSITLGALFFTLLQHVTSAGWSVVVRRIAEAMTAAFPVMGLLVLAFLVLPVLMGKPWTYDWADSAFVDGHELVKHKAGYLNAGFLLVRVLLYFAIWIGISRFFAGQSLAQDDDQDPNRTLKMQRRSGICLILFGVSLTFCCFDLMMSLNAEWFSTMYGVYFFAGCFWSFLATLALSSMWLEKRGQLKNVVTVEHYHDIGKLLFAFTFFWSYVAFSQFMLYWYADIPEETHWFHYRIWGSWTGASMLLLVGHFLIPFLGLLSRHVKRRRNVLAAWCVYCLVFHYVDLYWNVMPEMVNGQPGGNPAEVGPAFGLIEVTAMIGVGGLFAFAFLKRLDGKPALAIGDPRLSESLAFQNI